MWAFLGKLRPRKVGVKLQLGIAEVSGEWEPNTAERAAAWELYVELVTRVATVPLTPAQGSLREALSSLYSVFAIARDVLRKYGPAVAQPKLLGQFNFGYLAVVILNEGLRPMLTEWHPRLLDWEERRPERVSRIAHEQAWAHAEELRDRIEETRLLLVDYADILARACGVPRFLADGGGVYESNSSGPSMVTDS